MMFLQDGKLRFPPFVIFYGNTRCLTLIYSRFFARAALTVLRRQKAVRYWKSIAPIMANETEPVSIDVLWKALNYSGYFFPFCYEEKAKPITCEKV